jgi:TRAP-type C4-dicarboxylate transport system permease small subunit
VTAAAPLPGEVGPPPAGAVDRIGRWAENFVLCAFLFAMIALAASQPLLRELAGRGFAWGDEALRLLVLWSAMIGAIAASRDDVHLRIDVASRFLPRRPRAVVALLVDLFSAGVAGVLAWQSWRFVAETREFGDVLLDGWPAWILQLILPVAFALIAWRYLMLAAGRARDALRPVGAPR